MKESIKQDKHGNKLKIDMNGNIALKVSGSNRIRDIGKVFVVDEEIKTYRKIVKKKHIMYTGDAWGINYEVLSMLPDDAVVRFVYPEGNKVYELTKKEIVETYGYYSHFKQQGFELQMFVARKDWNIRPFIGGKAGE